jgi:putative flippase GtrA
MNDVEVLRAPEVLAPSAAPSTDGPWTRLFTLIRRPPLIVRYGLIAGVIGVPASIAQLAVLLWGYERAFGDYGWLALNAVWLVNFEIGLLRNFVMHCAYTWHMRPTWERVRHAHVAATGAVIIDLIAFNVVVMTTGIIPLAQVFGAGSGFIFNFGHNALKTFAHGRKVVIERVAP